VLFHAFLYVAYAVLNTAAMAAAKAALPRFAAGRRNAALCSLALGGGLYAVVLAVMLLLLKDGEASTVLPIAIGCTVLSTSLAGNHFYGERLTGRKLAGTVLITAGIALIFVGGVP
jgi:uncharacterized membrane protein